MDIHICTKQKIFGVKANAFIEKQGGLPVKFVPLTAQTEGKTLLETEYAQAYAVGKLRLGQERLYFRAGLRAYYIPYRDIRRYFRRVTEVPAKLCCGRGNFAIESLVICDEARELAQIELPGERAAKAVMARLAELAPDAAVGAAREEAKEGNA